jgi:flagellar protein FlhE
MRLLKGIACLMLTACSLAPTTSIAAPGSWVSAGESVRLFTAGRAVESQPLVPRGDLMKGTRIRQIHWQYRSPPGQPFLEAWLCASRQCIRLGGARGSSRALAGLAADQPLHFRFRLPEGRQPAKPFRVEGLQVIVDFR